MRAGTFAALLAVLCAHPSAAGAGPASSAIVPAFSIAKSENKNQVQYVIRLDDHCAPLGSSPVSAYWRMIEEGPRAHLFNVYVHLKWDGVDYLLLQGWSLDGSHVVHEKVAQ